MSHCVYYFNFFVFIEGQASGSTTTSITQDSSWSADSWSSWSMSWDTGQEKQAKEKPKSTSLLQDKSKNLSPREGFKSVSLKSHDTKKNQQESKKLTISKEEKVKIDQVTEKSGEKIDIEGKESSLQDSVHCKSKVEDSAKMTVNSESVEINESEATTQLEETKTRMDKKSVSDKEHVEESSSFLTGSGTGNSDRLSPLSHGSGETISSDSHSYEKVQCEKSLNDVQSLHSINSGDEMSDLNSGTKLSDLVTEEKPNDDLPSVISGDSQADIGLDSGNSNRVESTDSSNAFDAEIYTDIDKDNVGHPSENVPVLSDATLEMTEDCGNELSQENEKAVNTTELTTEASPLSYEKDILGSQENDIPGMDHEKKSEDMFPSEMSLQVEAIDSNSECGNIESENVISKIPLDKNVTASISPVTSYIKSSTSESQDEQSSSPLANSSSGEGSKLDSSIDTDDTVVDPSAKADSDSMGSVSPSSSYVKCMIEEAMDCNVKIEDNSSDGHSIGKSECSRSTGGHESGDEIDTTTSSDIEIISTPTSNGDSNKFIDLSPLKIALQKTARRSDGSHKRNDSHDSQSSSSSHSRGEQLSPGRDTDSSEDGVEMKITSEEASKVYGYLKFMYQRYLSRNLFLM